MGYVDFEDDSSPSRVPPHSLAAEEALLGASILAQVALTTALECVVPGDFYKPTHGLIFEALAVMHKNGESVDITTVCDRMRALGTLEAIGGGSTILTLISGTPSTSNAGVYARTVSDFAVLRKVIEVALATSEAAYNPGSDPAFLVEKAQSGFSEALSGLASENPDDLWILDDFLDRPLEDRPAWVIPGLLRKGWRAMLVASEGSGKTVLFRQIAIAASQGIHPLSFQPMTPCRVLIVDLENPEDSIHDVCAPLRKQAERVSSDYDRERDHLWHRPGGINLRNRRDRMELEAVIAKSRPDLVCLGPLYKCYNVSANESDEQAAKEVMQCFDDLRTRYNFALLLEHHAPKGSGKTRDLLPYGSSLWLRWPEIGLKMTDTTGDGSVMKVGRWRGDRLDNKWPVELRRSSPWMWEGVWPNGTFNDPGAKRVPVRSDFKSEPVESNGVEYVAPRSNTVLLAQGSYSASQQEDVDDYYDPPF